MTRTARHRTPRMPAHDARKPRLRAQPTSPSSALSKSTFSLIAQKKPHTSGPPLGTPAAGGRVRITAAWAVTAASVGKSRTSTWRRALTRALRYAARMRKSRRRSGSFRLGHCLQPRCRTSCGWRATFFCASRKSTDAAPRFTPNRCARGTDRVDTRTSARWR